MGNERSLDASARWAANQESATTHEPSHWVYHERSNMAGSEAQLSRIPGAGYTRRINLRRASIPVQCHSR